MKRNLSAMLSGAGKTLARAAILVIGMMLGSFSVVSCAPSYADNDNRKLNLILERLDAIDAQMADTKAQLATQSAQLTQAAGPSATASFCISQGRGLELGAGYGVAIKSEADLGAGWPNVLKVDANGKIEFPAGFLPTEAKVGIAGNLGRGMDICVDVPVMLTPEDQARLTQIESDINVKTGNGFFAQGKFQRRAGRIINYAAVRVPGNQRTALLQRKMQLTGQFEMAQSDDEAESEFDRADDAAEGLLDSGLSAGSKGFSLFGDGKIRELLATMDLPVGVSNVLNEPEQILDQLPDLKGGKGPVSCDELGISADIRARRPRVDALCNRLTDLPDFDRTTSAVDAANDLFEGLQDWMEPLFNNVSDNRDTRKANFCNSAIGQRRAFNRYCGRG
jgi:hypothetical protein